MIVKAMNFDLGELNPVEMTIYANVQKIYKSRDENNVDYLKLEIKGQKEQEYMPLTYIEDEENRPAVWGQVWLMTDDGKTIERLV